MLALFKCIMYKGIKFIANKVQILGVFNMKKVIHPDYHEITYIMTDGQKYTTRSTLGKAGDVITLEVDPKSHPVWTGVRRLVDTGGQLSKFKSKYGAFGIKTGDAE